ncbi:MAG: xanthine dehydrogenase family protein [Elusimicrobia bacterium]|nr:xanthine dehydrogenase family protein [Elusimicrobiota bacterium]
MGAVGTNAIRLEGAEKLCGRTKFIDDYTFEDCLYGVTLRAAIPYGRVKRISLDPNFPWDECTVVTAKDIPGKNFIAAIENDQPALVEENVLHPMQALLLVAHPSRQKAYEALGRIEVEYEELEPVLTIEDSLALKAVLREPDNVFKDVRIDKGDITSGFAAADVVVEGEYRLPHQEQAYIEPNGMAAWLEKDGALIAAGSMQCPYYVHKALLHVLGLPAEKVRVIQAATGGAFGGKEDYPSMLAAHAALLAWKSKRPVKVIYDRLEDMASTTKRHPALIRHRTGVTRDGRLSAQDIEVLFDGGAYSTMSPVVLTRGAIHASGAYACPNVRIRAKAVATNSPPNGAFRGFGVPQTMFAAELHMDRIAEALRMDPLELRRRNVLKEGSSTATGQVLRRSVGACDVLEACAKKGRYAKKVKECAAWNRKAKNATWRGAGLALAYHGGGFTGGGEDFYASRAGVALEADGAIRVLSASTEMGQGASTVFAQIAADALGVPFGWVSVQTPDTAKVPNSGPTVASRTTMIVGRLVERAARRLKAELEEASGRIPKTRPLWLKAARKFLAGRGRREIISQYERPPGIHWDDKACRGDAYGAFAYAAALVELEVDKTTYEVRVRKVVTAHEIGRAVHPLFAEGQIIGGIAQGLGYALCENAVYKRGVMQNPHFTDYIIPTALDVPPMEVLILEKPYDYGAFGSKGLGELPMDVPAPAAAAALRQATGKWFFDLPILPEKICKALHEDHI